MQCKTIWDSGLWTWTFDFCLIWILFHSLAGEKLFLIWSLFLGAVIFQFWSVGMVCSCPSVPENRFLLHPRVPENHFPILFIPNPKSKPYTLKTSVNLDEQTHCPYLYKKIIHFFIIVPFWPRRDSNSRWSRWYPSVLLTELSGIWWKL